MNGQYVDPMEFHSNRFNTMVETLQVLIELGADVTALDITHSTPLHLASASRIPRIVQILVENGADVNAKNETHSTPLHRASVMGRAESVQLLIEHGADVTAQDWRHRTPLHLASSNVSAESVSPSFRLRAILKGQDDCYVLVERSSRLELGGYDSVVWHIVLEACASSTL